MSSAKRFTTCNHERFLTITQEEIDLHCELTPRQIYLYKALRANSSVAELLPQAANFATDAAATASLMNLVMQFRKVRWSL